MTAPNRARLEIILGQPLLDWQWNTLLGILGYLPTVLHTPGRGGGNDQQEGATPPSGATPPPPAGDQDEPSVVVPENDNSGAGTTTEPPETIDEPLPRCTPASTFKHGTAYGYDKKKCRCNLCKSAKAIQNQKYRDRKKAGQSSAPTITPPSNPCAKPEPPQVNTPAPAPSDTRCATPGVTARCQDCSRTWTLTGRVLDQAIEMHELRHAHIVTIHDQEATA